MVGGEVNADAAAALLGTTPVVLSLWEERFGYPVPVSRNDGQRLYPKDMMVELRDALSRGLSIASAITEARRTQPEREATTEVRADLRHRVFALLENPEEAR
jgi:DNA-binding transcriptional MerR regulator